LYDQFIRTVLILCVMTSAESCMTVAKGCMTNTVMSASAQGVYFFVHPIRIDTPLTALLHEYCVCRGYNVQLRFETSTCLSQTN
jgi:hypothetical protein